MQGFRTVSDFPFDVDEGEPEVPLASAVLVVDDEPVVRDVLARLLSREPDLVVLQAESAEDGLEILSERRVDLLVTDKNLPGLGGIELLREAKRRSPWLEAIMITGYASAESVIGAFSAGASDYLLKPFDDLQVVKAKLRSALERRSERVQLRARTQELAREAESLMGGGREAPEPVWNALEECIRGHDSVIRGEARGDVVVLDDPEAIEVINRAGLPARPGTSEDLDGSDVAIIPTHLLPWRELAARTLESGSEVLLVAHPGAELPELLDAISLRLELIGFGTGSTELLPSRVRAALLRRGLQRAQLRLTDALESFREALG